MKLSSPCTCIIGANLSEPHIDELAVEFVYIYILYIVRCAISHLTLSATPSLSTTPSVTTTPTPQVGEVLCCP